MEERLEWCSYLEIQPKRLWKCLLSLVKPNCNHGLFLRIEWVCCGCGCLSFPPSFCNPIQKMLGLFVCFCLVSFGGLGAFLWFCLCCFVFCECICFLVKAFLWILKVISSVILIIFFNLFDSITRMYCVWIKLLDVLQWARWKQTKIKVSMWVIKKEGCAW